MKKHTEKAIISTLLAVVLTALCFAGCGQHLPEEYVEYEVSENKELGCIELIRDGIVFRPYGIITDDGFRGNQIGVRENDTKSIICEVKGYSSEEWITEYLDVFMGGGDMLYKAVGVTEIPEELKQFRQYDY